MPSNLSERTLFSVWSEDMEGFYDNASPFMHLNIKTNKQWKNLFTSEATFRNFIVMQIRKPENEGTLFREYWKKIGEKN